MEMQINLDKMRKRLKKQQNVLMTAHMADVPIVEIPSYRNVLKRCLPPNCVSTANERQDQDSYQHRLRTYPVGANYQRGELMTNEEQTYAIGDWVVHLIYGVGQVKKIEKKPIGGAMQLCYHVKTADGVFWLPTDNADNERVRPIASTKKIQRALNALKSAPKKMAGNFQTRRKRIRKVSLDGDLSTDLKLVRDLNARQFKKGLNGTEQDAFNTIIKRFLQEWSLSVGIEMREARHKLEWFLQESRKKAKQENKTVAV